MESDNDQWRSWCHSVYGLTAPESAGVRSFLSALSFEHRDEVLRELESVEQAVEKAKRPTKSTAPLISTILELQRQRQQLVEALGLALANTAPWGPWFEALDNLLVPCWSSLGPKTRQGVIHDLSGLLADILIFDGKQAQEGHNQHKLKYYLPPRLDSLRAIKAVKDQEEGEILESLAHGRVRLSPRQRSNYGMRYAGNAGF
ncbi:hypothetical protein JCM5296_000058 [Sporobolomyces johnsonii]